MTDPTSTPPPDDDADLQAAEYVLGTLEASERDALRDRAMVDGARAARIRKWEARLAVFNDGYDEAPPPPDLLPRIEAALFPPSDPARARTQRGGFLTGWLGGALAAAALAAVLFVALAQFRPGPPPPVSLSAELAAEDTDLRLSARWDGAAGVLEVTRTAGDRPATQDYELWLIDVTGVPQSLGLLRAEVTQLPVALAPGQVLAVSLEPEGGSPADAPTGPVLAVAELTEL